MKKIYDVIVIGGGPGGISATLEAKARGMQNILLIEKGDNHSQTIRKFYKDRKRVDKDWKGQIIQIEGNVGFEDGTKESTLDYFDSLLDNEEIDTAFNTEVETIVKEGNIFSVTTAKNDFQAKAIVIAIGKMGKPNKPDYKIPPSLRQVVNFNLDRCSQGEKILVVGGGNTAAEYAIELSRINTVTLNYRKASFTRLNEVNKKQLLEYDGQELLRLRLGIDITALENESGQVKVYYDDGNFTIYDRVVYAIGGTTPIEFLKKCGVTFDESNSPIFDENYETEVPGLYLSGDIAAKDGGSIALALNHSFKIIEHAASKK
ncbi:MAG: NAD(P)-binding domain-containing protein [Sulfurospirillaceae bacterium]|jgi:thioredoxin reductase (NADPH)|nr:NAD(P)-binding domain-containing protein [Sulfurospirillaceae bacterium]MCK9546307.1 NAD(P)-binding domain-containing protein [Sulfurospirillaceae bacterium]MDY0238853.1 NAD(P)-binding domain-containing protein [Campylobacterales bacterium]NLM98500.1 NAD(P)-binding domain-containing protein [Campylobacteraceae bacterium]